MKYVTLFLFVVLPSLLYSQEGFLTHYQNRLKSTQLPIIGSALVPEQWNIQFPDSIYDSGIVSIKRLRAENFKLKNLKITFHSEIIQTIEFVLKKHNSTNDLDAILNTVFSDFNNQNKESVILLNGEPLNGLTTQEIKRNSHISIQYNNQ